MSNQRLVLIVGLGHSGTTILDAALGCSPQVVGIGEAIRMISPKKPLLGSNWNLIRSGNLNEVFCTCGQNVDSCPVWKETAQKLFEDKESTGESVFTFEGMFKSIYSSAQNTKQGAKYVLDSTPGSLEYIGGLDDFDIKVINVTRDVRSWAVSRSKRRGTSVWLSELIWAKNTRRISKKLNLINSPILRIGYEEFALRPAITLELICDWLDITYTENMLSPFIHTDSHIIEGNPSILDKNLAKRIQYDGTWMTDQSNPWFKGFLYNFLAKRNHDLVYSNKIIGHKK